MRGVIEIENSEDLQILKDVLIDETEERRSKAKIYLTHNKLVIDIVAKDFNALRASVNAYLRQVRVCAEMLEVIKDG